MMRTCISQIAQKRAAHHGHSSTHCNPSEHLCIIGIASRDGPHIETRSDKVSKEWGNGAWGSLCPVCLPSSSSKALVTAAFTPILATRTRLVKVSRHIGVMNATEIISCSDMLHRAVQSTCMATSATALARPIVLRGRSRGEKAITKVGTTYRYGVQRSGSNGGHRCFLLNVSSPVLQFGRTRTNSFLRGNIGHNYYMDFYDFRPDTHPQSAHRAA